MMNPPIATFSPDRVSSRVEMLSNRGGLAAGGVSPKLELGRGHCSGLWRWGRSLLPWDLASQSGYCWSGSPLLEVGVGVSVRLVGVAPLTVE